MKYKVECKSLLLQKALEGFLAEYLDENGVIVSDEKGDIIIGKDIQKPFSKSQLLLQLESFIQKQQIQNRLDATQNQESLEIDMSVFDDLIKKEIPTESFDEKLDKLIGEFSIKLKKLIKEEYDKK